MSAASIARGEGVYLLTKAGSFRTRDQNKNKEVALFSRRQKTTGGPTIGPPFG